MTSLRRSGCADVLPPLTEVLGRLAPASRSGLSGEDRWLLGIMLAGMASILLAALSLYAGKVPQGTARLWANLSLLLVYLAAICQLVVSMRGTGALLRKAMGVVEATEHDIAAESTLVADLCDRRLPVHVLRAYAKHLELRVALLQRRTLLIGILTALVSGFKAIDPDRASGAELWAGLLLVGGVIGALALQPTIERLSRAAMVFNVAADTLSAADRPSSVSRLRRR